MRRVALLMSLLCSLALASNSFLADFHPLGPHPTLEPLHACVAVSGTFEEDAFRCQNKGHQTVAVLHRRDARPPLLTIDLPTGLRLQPVLAPMPAQLAGFWIADLNRDGLPDYLLNVSWNGNGIEGEASVVLCLLSSSTGYQAMAFDDMLFDPFAVVRLDRGLPVLLETALVSATDRYGVWHSFWVHHFLRVKGDHLVLSTRAPVWVQYKLRPDPQPTRLLTAQQERRAWQAYTTSAEWRGFFVPVMISSAMLVPGQPK